MPTFGPCNLSFVALKRVREPRYRAFGRQLERWRGNRSIETVVRLVRKMGVGFDASTLRGWEYGWTASPDPLRLLALARVYGVDIQDVMSALASARSHGGTSITVPGLTDARDVDAITDRAGGLSDEAVEVAKTFDGLSKANRLVVLATISAIERTQADTRTRRAARTDSSAKRR